MSEWKSLTYPYRPVVGALYLSNIGRMWLCIAEPVFQHDSWCTKIFYMEDNSILPWTVSCSNLRNPLIGMKVLEPENG